MKNHPLIKNKGGKGVPGNLQLRGKITKKMMDAYHSAKGKKVALK